MASQPIKTSELLQDDGGIQRVIDQLQKVASELENLRNKERVKAQELTATVKQLSVATSEQREQVAASAQEAEKIKNAYDGYTVKLKTTNAELERMKAEQKRVNDLTKLQTKLADALEDSYDALSAQYRLNKIQLDAMSKAQREGTAEGRKLEAQTKAIYEEMDRLQKATGKAQLSVGNYASALTSLTVVDMAKLTTIAGAVEFAGEAAAAAIQYVTDLTKEFTALRGEVSTLTGASGATLDKFTADIAAISQTFNQDSSEILLAANTVSERLGISFQESLNRISEGFVAGSNANGEFLQSLQEYPAFFKEAGLSADAFFAVINAGATGGVFNDKAVDAVKEVTLRLRELPKATTDALTAIGLSSDQIRVQIEKEGVGAAIATVSKRLGELRRDSPEVGQAVADIFGSPGEDAGIDFLISLQNINRATGSLIDKTNAYQQQQLKTLEVNKEFAAIQNEVAKELGGTGATLENVGTQIKGFFLQTLLNAIQRFKEFFSIFAPLRDAFVQLGQQLGVFDKQGKQSETTQKALNFIFQASLLPLKLVVDLVTLLVQGYTKFIEKGKEVLTFLGILERQQKGTAQVSKEGLDAMLGYVGATQKANDENGKYIKALQTKSDKSKDASNKTKDLTTSTKDYGKAVKATAVEVDALAAGSIGALQKKVNELKGELDRAAPDNVPGIMQKLLGAEAALKEAEDFQKALRERLLNGVQNISLQPIGSRAGVTTATTQRTGEVGAIAGANQPEPPKEGDGSIYDLLGIKIDEEDKQNIADAFSFAKQQLFDFLAVRKQVADEAVAAADREVSAAENALTREIENRNAGFADKVATAQKELQEAQKNQEKALKEQEKAQKAQERIQTIQQSVDLISAAAKIFAQKGDPFISIALVALMFGAFAAAKIKAAQLTKKKFSKGGFETIGGGTHASGDDTYLGFESEGKPAFAERGEAHAIFNTAATRKYRSVLPQIVAAANKLQLEEQFLSRARAADGIPMFVTANVDTAKMEDYLKRIADRDKKHEATYYTDGQGRLVKRYRNVTTIYINQ